MSNTKFGAQTQLERQQKQQKGQQKTEQQRTYVLHLQQPKDKPRVSWTQDTIDNENMNKKKSNLCCIYHRPGQESSDTCTSDDQGNALQRDRHTKHLHKKKCSKLNKKSNHNQKHEQNRQQNDKNLKFDS